MSNYDAALQQLEQIYNASPLAAAGQRNLRPLAASLADPAFKLTHEGSGRSAFFPVPQVPEGFDWPQREGREMVQVARLDLAEMAAIYRMDWLPDAGTVAVFVDAEEYWEPDALTVRFFPPDIPLISRPGPPEPYQTRAMGFELIASLPSYERMLGWELEHEGEAVTEEEIHMLSELSEVQFEVSQKHQVGGYPFPVQGDQFELLAEAASRGMSLSSPEIDDLMEPAERWRLLLQLDSDSDHGSVWGDAGILYVWIAEEDGRSGDFSRTHFEFQCC